MLEMLDVDDTSCCFTKSYCFGLNLYHENRHHREEILSAPLFRARFWRRGLLVETRREYGT